MKKKNTIWNSLLTAWKGLEVTFRHIFAAGKKRQPGGVAEDNYFKQQEGLVTIQYPREKIPVPEVGRYQLHVEIDDCIVCDLCAKICPVDCIEIEAIKAVEDIGVTSDGTRKRLHAARFDIDMAKCMYCGLCATVCPTECIIMTDTYDKSVTSMPEMTYRFSEMTPEQIAEKKRMLEESRKANEATRP
ncbi:MAG TPA: 4Fe-4S binding protein [Anseongella sp.]|nr:4Fe-4S binding protein [Anseongella sp.]